MRFRRASLVGTLMAAALSLLIILPAAADEGPGAADSTPYLVSLQQGWNLISIPADPANPAIGSVLPLAHPAESVFGYQVGEWLVAVRDGDTGEWFGPLTEIVAGYGYYLHTPDSTPLETVLSETDPDPPPIPSLPPPPPLTEWPCGSSGLINWNLLGVIDPNRAPQGATIDADEYLDEYLGATWTSLDWAMAYGFDTETDRWTKIVQRAEHNLKNGSGYWVWVTGPSVLCP